MSELRAEKEITYTLSGLTFKDMELLCLGLDDLASCDSEMLDRKVELIKTIEYILPTPPDTVDWGVESQSR